MSWPKGQGLTLCAALEPIVEALEPQPPALELPDLAATPADGLDCLGGGWPLTDTERASLTEALHAPRRSRNRKGWPCCAGWPRPRPRQVHDLTALETLLGKRLRISPSQLEKYYTCRYGYFLQYVLGLRPRRRAELSADQSGSLMHWVLQMALDPDPAPDNPCANMPAPFIELDDEAMAQLAGLLVDEYARRYLPEDTARFTHLLSRLKKSMASLLCYLRDEQRQSCFKPVACELKIGRGEDAVPPQLYHLSDGRTVQLIGTVDRADEWVEEDGTRWVRVVDYKTGTKKLDLKEVYCGLDCQMLLYLFSLTRDASGRFTGAEPAGVLYLLADPAPRKHHPAPTPPAVWNTSWMVWCGTRKRSSGPWTPRRRAGICPSAICRRAQPLPEGQAGRRGQAQPHPTASGRPCDPDGRTALRRADRRRAAGHGPQPPAGGAITASSAATRAASANERWTPPPSPLKPLKKPRKRRNSREWTQMERAQQAAIDDRGGALLVSAAAGSGKTAVLTERAVRLITDPEAPIDADKLLIVTFTNAAAAELRARIGQALLRRSQAEPGNTAPAPPADAAAARPHLYHRCLLP